MEQGPTTKVLVVDDDEDLRTLMRLHLTGCGYAVLGAADGAEAVRIILAVRPDLVVMDWVMPDLTGIDVCRLVRRAHDDIGIPVILVTGNVDEADRARGMAAGADDYLTKPFTMDELAERVTKVLDRVRV